MKKSCKKETIKINPIHNGLIVKPLRFIYRLIRVFFSRNAVNLNDIREKNYTHIMVTKEVNNFIPATYKIKQIFTGVEDFPFLKIYVHGSWADDTRTPFSDLDDLVLVDTDKITNKSEALRAERWLNKVDMRFCRIDPLQHHGHWLIEEILLEKLDESYIPLSVLNKSMRVQGTNKISYKVDVERTLVGLKRNIELTCRNIVELNRKYTNNKITIYEMKRLIGSFLLLPAYLFQYKGIEVSKKGGIERKNEIFSKNVCILLDKCSNIRNNWGVITESFGFKLLKYSAYLFTNPYLFRRFSKQFSPAFPKASFPIFSENEVNQFLDEINNHASCQ